MKKDNKMVMFTRNLLVKASPVLGDSLAKFAIRFGYTIRLLQWIQKHPCKEFNERGSFSTFALKAFVLETEGLTGEIDYLEFGVAHGSTLKWWVEKNTHPNTKFFGFDIFTGLPEEWFYAPKGSYTTNGELPQIEDSRCEFVVGLFQNTLFPFLQKASLTRRKVVHIDSDLYNSSLYVLTTLAPYLAKDDIIIFDDFGGLRNPLDDFRSFNDFFSAYKFTYEVLGAADFYRKIAIKITSTSAEVE